MPTPCSIENHRHEISKELHNSAINEDLESLTMDDNTDTDTIELSSDVVSRVEKRVQQTRFDDSSDYIQHVLEEVLWQIERGEVNTEMGDETGDESLVEDRLEALGYLNE